MMNEKMKILNDIENEVGLCGECISILKRDKDFFNSLRGKKRSQLSKQKTDALTQNYTPSLKLVYEPDTMCDRRGYVLIETYTSTYEPLDISCNFYVKRLIFDDIAKSVGVISYRDIGSCNNSICRQLKDALDNTDKTEYEVDDFNAYPIISRLEERIAKLRNQATKLVKESDEVTCECDTDGEYGYFFTEAAMKYYEYKLISAMKALSVGTELHKLSNNCIRRQLRDYGVIYTDDVEDENTDNKSYYYDDSLTVDYDEIINNLIRGLDRKDDKG